MTKLKAKERIKSALISGALRPWNMIRRLIFATGLIVWVMIISLTAYTWHLLDIVPPEDEVTSANMKTLALQQIHKRIPDRKFHWIDLKNVNRDLIYAIVLSEDGNYFAHNGVDYDAIIAALAENLKSQRWKFGASTISQQTAKNLFLSSAKTLSRKFQEVMLTRRLEESLTKNEILELYLNLAEFGPDIYGIAAACRYYFNKTPLEINAAEGAYLALLMPSPRKYHYTLFQNGNWSPALKKKHRRILRDMRYKELISASQYEAYRGWVYDKAKASSS